MPAVTCRLMRFVARARESPPAAEDVERLRSFPGVVVVERASDQLYLLEMEPDVAKALSEALPRWAIAGDARAVIPEEPRRPLRKPTE